MCIYCIDLIAFNMKVASPDEIILRRAVSSTQHTMKSDIVEWIANILRTKPGKSFHVHVI